MPAMSSNVTPVSSDTWNSSSAASPSGKAADDGVGAAGSARAPALRGPASDLPRGDSAGFGSFALRSFSAISTHPSAVFA